MFDLGIPESPLPLQQSPLYHAALTRIGAEAAFVSLPFGPALVLTRTLPLLGRVALISRPVWDDPPSLPALAGLRHSLKARALITNAETPGDGAALARAGFLRLAAPRPVAELPLSGCPEDWLARMGGKWRNRLRHGQRQGLAVSEAALPPDPQHWLFHKDAAQQATRSYAGLPPKLITAMAVAAPGALRLFTARRGARTVAAMLFALHGRGATYLIGWSGAEGRAASAHSLLIWQAMGALATHGAIRIDLGLCDGRRSPGLARFKRGSGAVVRDLGGTWGAGGPTVPLHALLRRLRGLSGSARARTAPIHPGAARCTGRVEGS